MGYHELIQLSAGTAIYPLGIYHDFVKAAVPAPSHEVTGFIRKELLTNVPSSLPDLQINEIPWEPLFLPACSPGVFDPDTNSVTFTNSGDGYYDNESNALTLQDPLRVRIDGMVVNGASFGSVKILGIPESQDVWWKGITRLDITYNRGSYLLGIRDGSSENFAASIPIALRTSDPIQIVFDQPEGKSFAVLDGKGLELKRVDLTQMSTLHLPNGLFPERKVYIGTSTSPHSSLVIAGLAVETTPDGLWQDQADPGSGLVGLAKSHSLTLGTEFSLYRTMDQRYCQIMHRDFNVVVLSEFSWKNLWLGPGKYDFGPIDQAVDYANRQGWRVRASHLVWGAVESNAIPDWLLNGHFRGTNTFRSWSNMSRPW